MAKRTTANEIESEPHTKRTRFDEGTPHRAECHTKRGMETIPEEDEEDINKLVASVDYWPNVLCSSDWKGKINEQLGCQPVRLLKQKDQVNNWQIIQAMVGMHGSEVDAETCRLALEVLKKRNLISMCSAKDFDGDTTLHTAIKTGDLRRINVLLHHLPPTLLNEILEITNNQGETPLQLVFNRQKWNICAKILQLCLKNNLCRHVTGIGETLTASTLLHKAMERGKHQFLEMYLNITRNFEYANPGLLVYDETGQTPWSYLMNSCDHECLKKILDILKLNQVDVNVLITDKASKSTMLHLAYRKNCLSCIELLKNAGADPEMLDKRGFKAHQRNHMNEEMQILFSVETAMQTKRKVDQTIIPCVFVGPPGNGKTSLMRRLIGKPASPPPSPSSTGVANKVIPVEIRPSSHTSAQINHSVWSELTLDDEAVALLKDISKSQGLHSQSDNPSHTPPLCSPIISTATESNMPDFQSKLPFNAEISAPPSSFKPPLEMFKDVLHTRGWSAACEYLERTCMVHLTDTGGQLEFQELLPALVSGPSVFFLVFRLDQDLNQTFTVEYRHPGKGCTIPYESSYTVKEFLLHTLASIASMGNYMCKDVQKRHVPLQPKVFFIGTHKDKVSIEQIEQIDHDLQQEIKCTDHYRSGIIQFANKKDLILAVNNLSPDDSDALLVRSAVERIRTQGNFDVSAPPQWLIFSLVIQKLKESVLTYDECFAIAKQCGIDTLGEVNDVLEFLSTKIGLIRHFQGTNVDEDLQTIVIKDPQVLFDRITDFIMATFTFENTDHVVCEDFQKKGIFTLNKFKEIYSTEGEKLLTPSTLLKLLQHLHVVAPIQETSGEVEYFIPCILAHAAMVDPKNVGSCQITNVSATPPLLLCFCCGYCPRGLFCSLIVYLLNNQMKSRFSWVLERKEIFRDQLSFSVGPYDSVSLKITPTFIEVNCTSSQPQFSRKFDFATVCREIRCAIESGVATVASTLHYNCNPADLLKLAFYCPHNHPAEIIFHDRVPYTLKCSGCQNRRRHSLSENCTVWFDERDVEYILHQDVNLGIVKESKLSPDEDALTSIDQASRKKVQIQRPSGHPSGTIQTALDSLSSDPPTLLELIRFRGRERRINIPQEIGVHYMTFGTLLLEDRSGMIIRNMEKKYQKNAEEINADALQQWVTGMGKQPVTWDSLIDVLLDTGLSTLASEIAAVKGSSVE